MAIKKKRKIRERKSSGRTALDSLTTREKIIDASKQHFAEFGLQHASVRAITKLAGVNSALIRYHFGSKGALYAEVVHRTAKRLIESRIDALNDLQLRFGRGVIPISELLLAYSRPILGGGDEENTKNAAIYLRFFGRMYTEPSDELRKITQSQFTDLQNLYIDELAKAATHVSKEEIILRFGLMIGALTFLGSKTGIIEMLSEGTVETSDTALTIDRFVTAYTAVFSAPPTAKVQKRAGRVRLEAI